MSATDFGPPPRGSWQRVWLAGAGVPFGIGLTVMAAMFVQACGCTARPDAFSWYLDALREMVFPSAICAAATALLFVGAMAWAERVRRLPLSVWLAGGLLAASPVALSPLYMVALSQHGPMRPIPVIAAAPYTLLFYGCGLIGAAIAFRVRHGSWRA